MPIWCVAGSLPAAAPVSDCALRGAVHATMLSGGGSRFILRNYVLVTFGAPVWGLIEEPEFNIVAIWRQRWGSISAGPFGWVLSG